MNETSELAHAMWKLLYEMGEGGFSVSRAAKAQARVALDPFITDMFEIQGLMSIEEARGIVEE